MRPSQGNRNRNLTLTSDTADAVLHTCNGVVDLSQHLIRTSHQFVLLGLFSTDPLEKYFSKLRQSSGGCYFISVQQVVERVRIDRTKLLLQEDVDFSDCASGHSCSNCNRELTEKEVECFDALEELCSAMSDDVMMALIYIAGYVIVRSQLE